MIRTTRQPCFYPGAVPDDMHQWPDAGHALIAELAGARGRIALVADAAQAGNRIVDRLHADLGLAVVSLGRALADRREPPTTDQIATACASATVITDIDLLFWPGSPARALHFLTARSRHQATIAVWPGHISGGRATYSAIGRPDYTDVALRDVIVLRPRVTRFPDEIPFSIERILP